MIRRLLLTPLLLGSFLVSLSCASVSPALPEDPSVVIDNEALVDEMPVIHEAMEKAKLFSLLKMATVRVYSPVGPYRGFISTGVVLHSSPEHGTYVLTNNHAVWIERDDLMSGIWEVPTIVLVDDSSRLMGQFTVIDTMTGIIVDKQTDMRSHIDLSLIWSPYLGATFQPFNGLADEEPEVNEQVTMISFAPEQAPYVSLGEIISDPAALYDNTMLTTPDARPGNSGSGIFDEDGLLIGIFQAISAKDGKISERELTVPPHEGESRLIGYYTPTMVVRHFLDGLDLLWVATLDTADDPSKYNLPDHEMRYRVLGIWYSEPEEEASEESPVEVG